MPKLDFNPEQQLVLEASSNESLGISAGAGSGKTRVLTEKVYSIISAKEVKPSELLVLTFTNNAAYEMKSRIFEKFKKENSPLADEIISAHIQTFDSFSSYLVRSNAHILNIPESFTVMDKTVFDAKIAQFIDEIFNEYYEDEILHNKLVKSLKKLSLFNDDEHRKILLDLYNKLSVMSLDKREKFIDNCYNKYYTTEFFDECMKSYIEINKEKIRKVLIKAYILDHFIRYKNVEDLDKNDFDTINNIDFRYLAFSNERLQEIYIAFRDLIMVEDSAEFLQLTKNFKENHKEIFPSKTPKTWFSEDDEYSLKVLEVLREIAPGAKSILAPFLKCFDYELEQEKQLYFKDDAELFIEMYIKLQNKVNEYKKRTASYSFFDINIMALSLLNRDDQIAKNILKRFKYVMVDEYQDTNEIKESFIDLFVKKGGATLFCVGDAKQSIYGFTGSNVNLFVERMNSLKKIDMNKNYRSGKKLISDMNYFFSHYLTLDKGGVDYKRPLEQLQYDDVTDIYKEPYDGFGVRRLVSISEQLDDWRYYTSDINAWERWAIINDIKKKVGKHYVYDRDIKGLRKAEYKDFVILTRTKNHFNQYLTDFARHGISLNLIESTNLKEADALIVIQSLLNLIADSFHYIELSEQQKKHNFYSVARSYLYQLDDEQIYDIIKGEGVQKLLDHQIMKDIDLFVEEEQDKPFSNVYIDMIERFSIIKKLYLIGFVGDNIDKIESLHKMIVNKENSGEGLIDFVELLKSINKFDLKFVADSLTSEEDAVTIMTVHASKGLENKIVYLPCSDNKFSTGSNIVPTVIEEKYGIVLPYYNFSTENRDEEGNIRPVNIKTIVGRLYDEELSIDKSEISEHRRLYYVALTRAENTVYIVGDANSIDDKKNKKERLYSLLDVCPSYLEINPVLIDKFLQNGTFTSKEVDEYEFAVDKIRNHVINSHQIENKENKEVLDEILTSEANKLIEAQINTVAPLFKKMLCYYTSNLSDITDDQIARIIGLTTLAIDAKDYDDLRKQDIERMDLPLEEQDGYLQGLEILIKKCFSEISQIDVVNIEDTKLFEDRYQAPIGHGLTYVKYLCALSYVFDNVTNPIYTSYQTKDFEDRKEHFNVYHFDWFPKNDKNRYKYAKTNNVDIEFEERVKHRASKIRLVDEDLPINEILERGSYLHRLLELTDLISKDTSFIKNEEDKKIIDNVLTNPIFDVIKDAKLYKEYGYYDEAFDTNGFIDLLAIKNDEYYIIDYKSKHVEDDGYEYQLHTYQRNIENIFKIKDKKKIHLYLVSILDNKILEIQPE